jgi:hypothetical protein
MRDMKNLNKKTYSYSLLTLLLLSVSCTELLEEQPRSQVVPSYFTTPAGLLGGIAGVYNEIRSVYGTEGFTLQQMAGTDEHLMGGSASGVQFFTYNGIQPTLMNGGFNVYTSINTLNGVLEYLEAAQLTEPVRKEYRGQAKFLRAFFYFNLVQTYGEVPLHTTFITTASQADEKAPVDEVYAQIIQDLTDASTELQAISPATATTEQPFGGKAASQGAALYLLGKVYLTRGWLTNSNADFQEAYNVLTNLITNRAVYGFDLWQDYNDAFNPANDYGKESIFVSDHSLNAAFGLYQLQAAGGAAQNVTPWLARWNYIDNLGINSTVDPATGLIKNAGDKMLFRDIPYGRPYTRIRPNSPRQTTGPNTGLSYIYDQAFNDRVNDSRYDNTFHTVWIANRNVSTAAGDLAYSGPGAVGTRGTLINGYDTAVWFADYEVPGAPHAEGSRPFKGVIVTPTMQSNTVYPAVKKMDDRTRADRNDPSPRPVIIYRFSDVYLLAAEAAFKLGNTSDAADLINVVRKRAAYRAIYPAGVTQAIAELAVTISPGDVTLDFILDERTREFFGEAYRWPDLVRTKSLLSRVAAWNPIEAGVNIKPHHVLRPIPQDQIDRVTAGDCQGNDCWQNPSYF